MARKKSKPPRELSHRWYLPEWAKLRGKRQSDAQRELGWAKATASDLWTGKQRYTQDLIDEVSQWLEIKPYELLMPPREAKTLRLFRETAAALVANGHGNDDETGDEPAGEDDQLRASKRTGTAG